MVSSERYEILIWTGGDEGRLWEWRPSTKWRVFEHYNYRHTFTESEITEHDLTVLRRHFNISGEIPGQEIIQLPPEELIHIAEKAKGG